MKHLKKALAALLLGAFFYSDSASAYTFSFTNGTNETVAVDFCGVAVIGCSMMQEGPAFKLVNPLKVRTMGKTKNVRNAGHLNGPQQIEPQGTLELNFNAMDFGICLDLANVKVGLQSQGFSMMPREVIALPNQYYDALFGAVSQFGGDVSKLGEAVSKIPNPEVAAAGAVGQSLGSMVGSVGQLVRHSTCKNMSFIIINDKGRVQVTTRGL